jgi:hypothetical protein
VDVLAFREQAASDDLAQWEEAVALYNGRFLDTLSLKDSDLFDEWLTLTRHQLQQQVIQTLGKVAQAYEQSSDYEKTAAFTRQQLAFEPWHEPAHRRLMRVLALNGRRVDALTQYETCRSQLSQELGIIPEPATIALYEQIRDGSLSAEIAVTQMTPEPGNLPTPLRPLVGRQQELSELSELLLDKRRRLLTILGVGGSGKTRLAVELGTAVRHHFPHGVYLINLANHNSLEAILPAIAEALGFTFYEGQPPQQQLVNYRRSKTNLLIFDNVEHWVEGSALLVVCLLAAPRLQVGATWRERLAWRGVGVVL